MKSTTEIKYSLERFNSKLEIAQIISNLEESSIEIIQSKEHRVKKTEEM